MEGEHEKSRDQTEGSGQQQPLGQQNEQQPQGQQSQQQPQGQQQGQQPLGQQANFGTQEPGPGNQTDQEVGSTGGQSATGQSQGGDTDTLSQDDVGQGGYSPESGASDLGGGETGLGDSGGSSNQGGFVGSQGQESGEYLHQRENPEPGFAEQGRGASNEDDSDIEGSNDKS